MDIAVAPTEGGLVVSELDKEGVTGPIANLSWTDFAAYVVEREPENPRWVWADTSVIYPHLLEAGVEVGRAQDLRLCHAILARSSYSTTPFSVPNPDRWRRTDVAALDQEPSLLDAPVDGREIDLREVIAEHHRQQMTVATSEPSGRLRLLLAAESAGALIAAELTWVGLPFDPLIHDRWLTEMLGSRPLPGGRPARLEELAGQIRTALQAPGLSPDSQPELLRALNSQGLGLENTRQWELEGIDHPAIPLVLEYKKLSRLWSANGWSWLNSWVHGGRFRPEYLPGGVVTGRWATRGGGALQLPKQVRAAVVAAPGCRLVVADAAQLEPRVLAAMARDEAMARASRRGDLYQALVDEGVVDTRAHAKVAMLGALYGATSGEAGLLMPRLVRTYPSATAYVEAAARAGERGQVVNTWLGRTSPPPAESWFEALRQANQPEASAAEQRRARSQTRDWGRFTRNFVVQGTAAEWALCWMADLRRQLRAMGEVEGRRPALVYFLHDEVIVETPAARENQVADAVRDAARRAGELLFGRFPVEFALDVHCVDHYAEAD